MVKVLILGSVYNGKQYLTGEVMMSEKQAESLVISGHVKVLPAEIPEVIKVEIQTEEVKTEETIKRKKKKECIAQ